MKRLSGVGISVVISAVLVGSGNVRAGPVEVFTDVGASGGAASGGGAAQLVTWQMSGTLEFAADETGFPEGAVQVGDPFVFTYTFDANTEGPGFFFDAITELTGQVGGVSFSGPAGELNQIVVRNDSLGSDGYSVGLDVEIQGAAATLWVIMRDSEATVFSSSTVLPVAPLPLEAFERRDFEIFSEFSETGGPFVGNIGGEIERIVPEPVTLWLVSLGAACSCAILRIRRHGHCHTTRE